MSYTYFNNYWDSHTPARADDAYFRTIRLRDRTDGMAALRNVFPDGKADDMNVVLFSTSGPHGSYTTIEALETRLQKIKTGELEEGSEDDFGETLTFVILQPRIVCTRFGLCIPKTEEDFEFLKKLRTSSLAALSQIGT